MVRIYKSLSSLSCKSWFSKKHWDQCRKKNWQPKEPSAWFLYCNDPWRLANCSHKYTVAWLCKTQLKHSAKCIILYHHQRMFTKYFVRLYPETVWNGAPTSYPPILSTRLNPKLYIQPANCSWSNRVMAAPTHHILEPVPSKYGETSSTKISPFFLNIFSLIIFKSSLLSNFVIKQSSIKRKEDSKSSNITRVD